MSLLQRARNSGTCPPSLLSEDRVVNEDGFDAAFLQVLDDKDFCLRPEGQSVSEFLGVLQKAKSINSIPGSVGPDRKKHVLDYRRCLILAAVGRTPVESPSLKRLLSEGYLNRVKTWLDDALRAPGGGVDLLLHLLSNIIHLPVTKQIVKESGLGKAIGSIEKHRICKGTPNESAIKDRVQQIKDAWHKSVKARKSSSAGSSGSSSSKRASDSLNSGPAAKKVKSEEQDDKKSSSFSSLMKKVSSSPAKTSKANGSSKIQQLKSSSTVASSTNSNGSNSSVDKLAKKSSAKRVKWADHFGGHIAVAEEVEGEEILGTKSVENVSWSDRKRRDRMREKELLAKARKSKLMDEDDDVDIPSPLQVTIEWRQPQLIPEQPDVAKAQLDSNEIQIQEDRMKDVNKARYSSEYDVPNSPAPLSDVEQALDMTSQASATVASIPFFVPSQPDTTVVTESTGYSESSSAQPSIAAPPVAESIATPEFVQSLGLPLFLVGQPVQALQTLASSPGLLSTLVDGNGMYDQPRLMSLVQSLSSSTNGYQSTPTPSYPQASGLYSAAAVPTSTYAQPTSSYQNSLTKNGVQAKKSDEGNLHVSGYGPNTTMADLIAAFSPYVHVDEVIMKGTFAFINTSNPVAAARAKEALTGTLIGNMPIRVNNAQRKNKDTSNSQVAVPSSSQTTTTGSSNLYGPTSTLNMSSTFPPPNLPTNVDAVRDDRGNPATKNLFIAGYGPGTTEEQLRALVSQFAQVTGVILKGNFSFVNTIDRANAVRAREMLTGTVFNGGTLRINFAKETGRLGTSFDLTYNTTSGPNAHRNTVPGVPAAPPPMSYYGRTY